MSDTLWNDVVLHQLDAALSMLGQALQKCPQALWEAHLWEDPNFPGGSAYWYLAYHSLFWADLDLYGGVEGFAPPAPFTLSELDPAGLLPDRIYTLAELLAYVDHIKSKAREKIGGMTAEQARKPGRGEIIYAERLINTIRHVQEHTAQLNLFLGQRAGLEERWITTPRNE